ncbi:MAG: glycosyltransferase family 4 protein [Myxococcota bacterium]
MVLGVLTGLRVTFCAFDPFPNHKGSGTRIAREVSALARAGADIELLTLAGEGELPLPGGVAHRPLRLREDNYLARALAFRRAVAERLRAHRPDWVHVRGPFEGRAALDVGLPLLFELNGLPSVELRYHHPQVGTDRSFLQRLVEFEREVLRGAKVWLTQSHATARFMRRVAQCSRAAEVIPNGADPAPERPAKLGSAPVRLVYAGALSPWQGLGALLPALRDLEPDPRWTLELVGGGRRAWRTDLHRRIRALGLKDRVVLHGAKSRAEVGALLLGADVALCPLRRDLRNRVQGCSPIKLFEYGAAGAAIVASDLPCLREIFEPHEAAWSLPKRRLLRETLAQLLNEPERRDALGAAARQAVLRRHQWRHREEALIAFYDREVVGFPSPSGAPKVSVRTSA